MCKRSGRTSSSQPCCLPTASLGTHGNEARGEVSSCKTTATRLVGTLGCRSRSVAANADAAPAARPSSSDAKLAGRNQRGDNRLHQPECPGARRHQTADELHYRKYGIAFADKDRPQPSDKRVSATDD